MTPTADEERSRNETLAAAIKLPRKEPRSVRTSFALTAAGYEGLEWLKSRGCPPKAVLDLRELREAFSNAHIEALLITSPRCEETPKTARVRRTFVVSKVAVREITEFARRHRLSRDELAERLVLTTKGMIVLASKILHGDQERATARFGELVEKAKEVAGEINKILKEDDPLLEMFRRGVVYIDMIYEDAKEALGTGEPIREDLAWRRAQGNPVREDGEERSATEEGGDA